MFVRMQCILKARHEFYHLKNCDIIGVTQFGEGVNGLTDTECGTD